MTAETNAAVHDFQTYLYENFDVDNNNPKFLCIVNYTAKGKTLRTKSIARLSVNTMDFGKISLEENGDLDANLHHLDFNPEWQEYDFNKDGSSLIVSGRSDKMKGNYRLTIIPTEGIR